jgi:hypothetical protein
MDCYDQPFHVSVHVLSRIGDKLLNVWFPEMTKE